MKSNFSLLLAVFIHSLVLAQSGGYVGKSTYIMEVCITSRRLLPNKNVKKPFKKLNEKQFRILVSRG